jgi:putative hemolysin
LKTADTKALASDREKNIMKLTHRITHPILKFLNRLFDYPPGWRSPGDQDDGEVFAEDIESVTQTPDTELEEEEKRMIHGVVELGETEVKEIMRPRPDMICVEEDATLEQIRELARGCGHSRIPMFKENIDHILGIIHVKDLFLLSGDQAKETKPSSLARKAYFIPESKKVDELLKEFKKDKIHMAIVVDEYGGTAGLVTLEDILEEIVGEIQDEYDKEVPAIQKTGERTYRVDAGVSIEDLNETLGTGIEEKGFETVGGFIYDLQGGVPDKGSVLEYRSEECSLSLLIEKVEGQRIKTVKIRILSPSGIPSNDLSGND